MFMWSICLWLTEANLQASNLRRESSFFCAFFLRYFCLESISSAGSCSLIENLLRLYSWSVGLYFVFLRVQVVRSASVLWGVPGTVSNPQQTPRRQGQGSQDWKGKLTLYRFPLSTSLHSYVTLKRHSRFWLMCSRETTSLLFRWRYLSFKKIMHCFHILSLLGFRTELSIT